MDNPLLLDGIMLIILLTFAGWGARKGLILAASRLISIAAGYLGAWFAALTLKKPIADKFFLPWITDLVNNSASAAYNPVEELLSQLKVMGAGAEADIMRELHDLGIPAFSLTGGFGRLLDKLTGTGTELLPAAANIISDRIAFVLLFIISFLIIQLVLLIITTNINGLTALPLASGINRICGAACGFLFGTFIVCLSLWLITTFIPGTAADASGFLSPEALKESRILPYLIKIQEMVLP